MNTEDNSFLHAAINAKLASVVAAAPIRPDWYEAWMCLGPESTEEERLKVYQSIRNAGTVPDEAGFYLIAWQIGPAYHFPSIVLPVRSTVVASQSA